MSDKCEVCYGNRWVCRVPSFKDEKGNATPLGQRVVPFQRSSWFQLGELSVAALLAAGALQSCACNAKKLAPWHPSFRSDNGGGAAEPSRW